MAQGGTKILFGLLVFLLIAGGLAGGGAWYLTENRVEGYQATATLLVDNAPGTFPPHDPGPPQAGPSPQTDMGQRAASALGIQPPPPPHPAIAPPDYATLFTSDQMAAALKESLAGAYGEQGLSADDLTLESVRKSMNAEAPVALQTRDNVVYRRVISLHVTEQSPELAAAGANAWAEAARDYAGGLAREDQADRERLLEEKWARLTEELNTQIEARDAAALQLREAEANRAAIQSSGDGSELRAQLARLEQDLARDEAALAALKSYVSKAPVAVVLELSVKEAELEATLAGSRAERDFVAKQVEALEPTPDSPPVNLADLRRQLDQANDRIAGLRGDVAKTEDTISRMASGANPVRIATAAVAPETPAGPHRYVIVGATAALGMIAGMILYFGLLTLRVYARELDRG